MKQKAVSRAFDRARELLAELPEADYVAFLARPVERAGDGLLFHREDALFGLEPGGPAHALDPLLGLLDALAHERPIALLGEALVLRADLGAARFALGADLGALGLRVRPDAGGHFFDPVHGSPNLADQAPLNRC